MQKELELRSIRIEASDFESIEAKIKELFKRQIYFPILREMRLPQNVLKNSVDDLLEAIRSGRITFSLGLFSGSFNASISKELRKLGAKWDSKGNAWKIYLSDLPIEVKHAISSSAYKFQEKLWSIDKKLAQILPDKIAGQLSVSKNFDSALWKVEKDFHASVKGITIAPQLNPVSVKKIADEWENNMRLWIKDFTAEEITRLRGDIKKAVFAGNRYESAIKSIQASYGVSAGKAKFLARQETNLLMTKFKEGRYKDAGVIYYKWGCVAGSKHHPVRASHKALEGKIFSWDNPPVTSGPGEPVRRNNPGEDFNCRCFARPVVKF